MSTEIRTGAARGPLQRSRACRRPLLALGPLLPKRHRDAAMSTDSYPTAAIGRSAGCACVEYRISSYGSYAHRTAHGGASRQWRCGSLLPWPPLAAAAASGHEY